MIEGVQTDCYPIDDFEPVRERIRERVRRRAMKETPTKEMP